MSFFAQCLGLARQLDQRLFSLEPLIRLPEEARRRLAANPLIIGDVGAAGGVGSRWAALQGSIRHLTFEPREGEQEAGATNFPICLGSRKETKVLNVARYPDSSSLYPINMDLMGSFAVRDCFETVGTQSVRVDTLDACLAPHPELSPDYLKLDVEGAELDVLLGAGKALTSSVLGLKVEVSFSPRHVGAPLYTHIDSHLRRFGFEVFAITREAMLRANLLHSPLSNPQVVWGDAVYFLTRASLLQRLGELPGNQRELVLTKFVALLLAHRIHDYALEIVEAAAGAGFASRETAARLTEGIRQSTGSNLAYLARTLGGIVFAVLLWLASCPIADARAKATYYFKKRCEYLFYFLWRLTARGGERNATISDFSG